MCVRVYRVSCRLVVFRQNLPNATHKILGTVSHSSQLPRSYIFYILHILRLSVIVHWQSCAQRAVISSEHGHWLFHSAKRQRRLAAVLICQRSYWLVLHAYIAGADVLCDRRTTSLRQAFHPPSVPCSKLQTSVSEQLLTGSLLCRVLCCKELVIICCYHFVAHKETEYC